jgi:hypothetical protein
MQEFIMQLKRRRRIARPLAAWHLLRHGSVIYGCHFEMTIPGPIKATPRPLLISNNYVDNERGDPRMSVTDEMVVRAIDELREEIAANRPDPRSAFIGG